MIGTRDGALTAWLIEQERTALGDEYDFRTGDNQTISYGDSWAHMGAGAARSTWLHIPSGVSYKIVRNDDPYNLRQSESEWRIWNEFKHYSDPALKARIPLMYAFSVERHLILAAETIHGKRGGSQTTEFSDMVSDMGITDLHPGNYRDTPSAQVLIDLGM